MGCPCRDGWQLLQTRDELAQPPGSAGHVPRLAGVTSPAHCGLSIQVIPGGMVPAGCPRHWGEHSRLFQREWFLLGAPGPGVSIQVISKDSGSCAPSRGECDPWGKHKLELCVKDGETPCREGRALSPGIQPCRHHVQAGGHNPSWVGHCYLLQGLERGVPGHLENISYVPIYICVCMYVCIYIFYGLQFIIIILQSMVWVGRNLKTMKF